MTLKNAQVSSANPFLLLVSGLCPVLMPSFTLQNGLILGFGISIHAVLLAAILPVLLRAVRRTLHFTIAMSLSALIALLYGILIRAVFPYEAFGLSPYLSILALNCYGLAILRGSLRQDSLEKVPEYAKSSAVLFFTVAVFSALREVLGSGRITFLQTETLQAVLDLRFLVRVPIRMALLPAGAFLLLGYSIALYRMRIQAKGRVKE